MVVDFFKDEAFWQYMERYNKDIKNVFDKYIKRYLNTSGGKIDEFKDINGNFIASWFDVYKLEIVPFSKYYPNLVPLNHDKKFNLFISRGNYFSLYLIQLLFRERRDEIIVEDAACGAGNLTLLLSKLGFKRFSLIENFTQISEFILMKTMEESKITFSLNQPEQQVNPHVYNQIAWGEILREITPSCELVIGLENLEKKYRDMLTKRNFVFLCRDSDELNVSFCRLDKYREFMEKIGKYTV